MSRFSKAAAAFMMVTALAGGNAGCISDPSMKLAGARVSNVSLYGVDLTMTMAVHNDNSFDVMVRDVRADVTLHDRYRLPTVQISPNIWLPADKTTQIDVPVTIPWNLVPGLVQTTLGSSTISYRAQGSANVTATRALSIDLDDFTVDEGGVLSRDALVNAAARSIFGAGVQPYPQQNGYTPQYGYPQQPQPYPNGPFPSNGQFPSNGYQPNGTGR